MAEPKITPELVAEHGLSDEEYHRIKEILGREPTFTELGVFSVMWSEHCSYKNSIELLKTLPREGKALLTEAGEENAGAVDIGDGMAVVFKIESHNHPTAVEPYQAAATGVGGILRDIFCMGARPIAALNSLRFGPLTLTRPRYLFDGAVRGIGDYGNSFGVPTVGGEVYFEECYIGNPLVNAMAVGICKVDRMASAIAQGVGNPVMIIGSSTGRDGIHGATFASEEISEKSEAKRPSVQIGNPFMEKLLLEATLEIIREDLIVGVQDMGAAGITCCSSEMSARGESGIDIDLDLVPVREEKMTAYEIMLSESQERMLMVGRPETEERIREICRKWDLNCVTIGQVTDSKRFVVRKDGKVVSDIPSDVLVLGGGAPVYTREQRRPAYLDKVQSYDFSSLPEPGGYQDILKRLLANHNIASKRWVYDQYDSMVRTNTAVGPGSDAAVMRIRKSSKALALATDCNGRYCHLNPRVGARIAVCEAARNVACSGARPVAITNCLNFGNPYKPEMYYLFAEAVAGMGEACRVLETPVTGGNVSFYNEDPDHAVYPTPTIGMLGIIDDVDHITTQHFKDEGDIILLAGNSTDELGGSEYLKEIHGLVTGDAPAIDLAFERYLQTFILESIGKGLVKSAHDISEGGLMVALAECCITDRENLIGARLNLESNVRRDALYFGESQSRVILSTDPRNKKTIVELARAQDTPLTVIGLVVGKRLLINEDINIPVSELADLYFESVGKAMA
ncbi:MAG: phosphoribosylformylglycinamidine synthase subunit PurL [candidate division Zixibacteria bacterium]|nr:phosphoribosylformylglycinamidine synthase subunit PurL [candidate division Zixibacteria bacterium]